MLIISVHVFLCWFWSSDVSCASRGRHARAVTELDRKWVGPAAPPRSARLRAVSGWTQPCLHHPGRCQSRHWLFNLRARLHARLRAQEEALLPPWWKTVEKRSENEWAESETEASGQSSAHAAPLYIYYSLTITSFQGNLVLLWWEGSNVWAKKVLNSSSRWRCGRVTPALLFCVFNKKLAWFWL